MVNTVVVRVCKDVVDNTALVGRRAMLTQMLDAPITELAVGDKVNVGNDFFNRRALIVSVRFAMRAI